MPRSVVHTAATPTRERIGHFDHYYERLQVMNLRIRSGQSVEIGDVIFVDCDKCVRVESMQYYGRTILGAHGPKTVGIWTGFRVEPGTRAYAVRQVPQG